MKTELHHDGYGINGPDEYRTRIATFRNQADADKYGALLAAAPDLLAALEASLAWVQQYHNLKGHEAASYCMAAVIDRALAKARGA
jgi:hypothetical protein